MTILSATDDLYTLTSRAYIVDDERDVASAWASKYITHNPAIKWIVGNYVEADNANSNGQYWTLDDLRLKGVTVNHAPMNIGHDQSSIVGSYVASEIIYSANAGEHPFIETVAAMWKHHFPEEFAVINKAHKEGSLFQSMECVADSLTCVGTEVACGKTFPYEGPYSPNYCEHIIEHDAARQFNNPHFLGGGLIVPPMKPGWNKAEINEVSRLTEVDAATDVMDQIAEEAPELDVAQWESLMQMIMLKEASKSSNLADAESAGRLLGIAVASTL